MTTTPDVLEAAKPWMQPCGSCDAGLPTSCTCPPGDPRALLARIAAELEAARKEVARSSETRRAAAIGAVRRLLRRRSEPLAAEVLSVLDHELHGGDRP